MLDNFCFGCDDYLECTDCPYLNRKGYTNSYDYCCLINQMRCVLQDLNVR